MNNIICSYDSVSSVDMMTELESDFAKGSVAIISCVASEHLKAEVNFFDCIEWLLLMHCIRCFFLIAFSLKGSVKKLPAAKPQLYRGSNLPVSWSSSLINHFTIFANSKQKSCFGLVQAITCTGTDPNLSNPTHIKKVEAFWQGSRKCKDKCS